jgi:hypothetical protein
MASPALIRPSVAATVAAGRVSRGPNSIAGKHSSRPSTSFRTGGMVCTPRPRTGRPEPRTTSNESWRSSSSGSTCSPNEPRRSQMAAERANAAVVLALTPSCVTRFMQQPNAAVKLKEFQAIDSWKQRELVEAGGWATSSGEMAPNSGVAGACAATPQGQDLAGRDRSPPPDGERFLASRSPGTPARRRARRSSSPARHGTRASPPPSSACPPPWRLSTPRPP